VVGAAGVPGLGAVGHVVAEELAGVPGEFGDERLGVVRGGDDAGLQ
jgi:hypothetical protein